MQDISSGLTVDTSAQFVGQVCASHVAQFVVVAHLSSILIEAALQSLTLKNPVALPNAIQSASLNDKLDAINSALALLALLVALYIL